MSGLSVLPVLLALGYLDACAADCSTAGFGEPVDLHQFSGGWYMVAGTPVTGNSLSRCGHFLVTRESVDTFTMRYDAFSNRHNKPVVFNVNGKVDGEITGTWQLEGSERKLGPFKHVVVAVDYGSSVAMVVCGGNNPTIPGHKFAMIWSREKFLSASELNLLKSKLADYVDRSSILVADHSHC